MYNEARKISQAQKQMYVAVNQMRDDMKRESSRHFQKAFDQEGFTDRSFWHWTPRKRERNGRGRDDGHKILTKTGKLRKSLKVSVFTTKETFVVRHSSSLKYAAIHNEGLMGKAWGHPFKMPKRKFMGYSYQLDKKLQRMFDRRIKRIFK